MRLSHIIVFAILGGLEAHAVILAGHFGAAGAADAGGVAERARGGQKAAVEGIVTERAVTFAQLLGLGHTLSKGLGCEVRTIAVR